MQQRIQLPLFQIKWTYLEAWMEAIKSESVETEWLKYDACDSCQFGCRIKCFRGPPSAHRPQFENPCNTNAISFQLWQGLYLLHLIQPLISVSPERCTSNEAVTLFYPNRLFRPKTLSACKAPVIQPPENLPTSQTRSIISPLSFSARLCPCISLPLLHASVHRIFWNKLSVPASFLTLQTPPHPHPHPISIHSPLLLWPLCQASRDSLSCGIPAAVLMILPPGPDQPEKYS